MGVRMVLSVTEEALFKNLEATLIRSRDRSSTLNDIYEGEATLRQLGLSIPDELKSFTVWLAWPRVLVDSVERRLDVSGFRMPGAATADTSLWDVWQYNNMDERQTFVHTDALALERSYVCVGTNEADRDYPLITVESPMEMVAVRDPRTHRVLAGLRLYDAGDTGRDQRATFYLPNRTLWLRRVNDRWENEFQPDEHNLGVAPIVPFVNRYRATPRKNSILEGVSEMIDIIPIAESASRALTNMQLAQETHAVPQRGVLGATKGDFVDADGNALTAWQAYFGSVWAMANSDAKTFQFDASDMRNFETALNVYARQASSVSSLPLDYFGVSTNQPPSADSLRAGETRHIKNAERKQTSYGHSWESVMRLVIRFRDGEWSDDARRMGATWRDAGTPTIAQVTDAVVKEYQAGLTDWESAQEQLGRSPEEIQRRMERRKREQDSALSFGVQRVADEV